MFNCFSFLKQMFSMENQQPGVEAVNPNGESRYRDDNSASHVQQAYPVNNTDGCSMMDADAYFDEKFPPGYRFKPYDTELVVCYLQKKITNEPLPPNRIKEVELYKFNPETLAGIYKPLGDNEWYFFTPRDRKYRNGKRPNRAAADGYWKATGADKRVEHNHVLVGFKKALVFYRGKPPKGDKTNWIMHEFRVDTPPIIRREDMRLDEWVLCRIYKKKKEQDRSRRGTSTGQEDDSIQDDQQSETEFQDSEAIDMAPETFVPQDSGLIDMSGYGYGNQGRFCSPYDNFFMYPQNTFHNHAVRLPGRAPQFSHYYPGQSSMWLPGENSTWTQQNFPASNHNPNQAGNSAAAAAAPRPTFQTFPASNKNLNLADNSSAAAAAARPTFQPMECNTKLEQFNGFHPSDYLDIPPEDSYLDDPHPHN